MNEADRFSTLLNNIETAMFFGEISKTNLEKFFKNISKGVMIQSDKPDIIIECETIIYGLEYFTFDSSSITKKGTSMRIEHAKIQREYDLIINKAIKNGSTDTVTHNATYQSGRGIDNYVNNYIRNFQAHYEKRKVYQKNNLLKTSNKKVELGFVIENTSILPDIVLDDKRRPRQLLPFNLTELQKFMINKNEIPHIFYVTHNGNNGYSIYYFFIYQN